MCDRCCDAPRVIPTAAATTLGLSGPALSQPNGEAASGAEHSAFQLMTEFLTLTLDPFVDGRFGLAPSGGPAIGFAPDQKDALPPDIALAYDLVLNKPPLSFDPRWTAWGAAFGGISYTNGNPSAGTNNLTASTVGYAAGMDYHLTPDWSSASRLRGAAPTGRLPTALALVAAMRFRPASRITRAGPAYVGGSLALANNWFTTNRSALGDQLNASFMGQSYGARIEGGYRYAALPILGVTPYAAIQAQDFSTPSFSETDVTGGGLGQTFAAQNAQRTGARFDSPTAIGRMPLVLRARLAWAHDFVNNPSLSAAFQVLPAANLL